MSRKIFLLCILLLKFCALSIATEKHTLEDLYILLTRIDGSLKTEDRIRQLTETVHIDRTLKAVEKQLEEISEKLDLSGDLDRHALPKDVRTNLVSIGNKMEQMESSVGTLEDILKKMNEDMQIISEVEQRTEDLKREMNHKLTKMMNVLSALYQINKDLKNDFGHSKKTEGDSTADIDLPGTTYLIDSLENLERKVKEQLSVLSVQMKTELDSLKAATTSLIYQCEKDEEDDDSSRIDNNKRKRDENFITKDVLEDIQSNIKRSQREITEELQSGLQHIDTRISHLTNMTSKSRCIDQDIEEDKTEHEAKESKVQPCVSVAAPSARNCADFRKAGNTCDGKYVILFNASKAIMVYCDMTTDGGGWTVLMRRGEFGDKEITFHQNWKSYKVGFGDLDGEFWLGNDNIHLLSNDVRNDLRIELESFNGKSKNFTFKAFYIEHENYDYRLHVGQPSGNSPSIREFNNRPFVSWDRIMDQPGDNCAEYYKGAWWYRRSCIYPDLTSERLDPEIVGKNPLTGMQSILWKEEGLLKSAEMKIRPINFKI